MEPSLSSLMLIPAAAVAAALLAHAARPFVRVPLVVFEIALGILLGPDVLGWVQVGEFSTTLANLGLSMLFFLAGYEIDMKLIAGRPLRRAAGGWLISLGLGLLIGLLAAPDVMGAGFIAVALASTALGTLLPILRDAGELRTPLGVAVVAVGSVGEFAPLVAISLFLSGRNPGTEAVFMLGFAAVAGALLLFAARGRHVRMHRAIEATMHTTGQFAMRLVILLIALLAGLSLWLDIDMLLGAFTAGLVFNLFLHSADERLVHDIETKLDAIGFGLLVPIFFIDTGLRFDLDALLDDRAAQIMLPLFVLALLVVRGLPSTLAAPPDATQHERRSLLLFGATALPVIVAVTDMAVEGNDLEPAMAAALVGAGMISVLVFPLLALGRRRLPVVEAPPATPAGLIDEG